MIDQQGKERLKVGGIIPDKIVKDQSEKQKDDTEKRQEKSSRQSGQTRHSVNIVVLVKNGIQ